MFVETKCKMLLKRWKLVGMNWYNNQSIEELCVLFLYFLFVTFNFIHEFKELKKTYSIL